MAKIEFDSILRCANTNCVHNREGYNCTCNVITLNADGQCALAQLKLKRKPVSEATTVTKFPDGTESETTSIVF